MAEIRQLHSYKYSTYSSLNRLLGSIFPDSVTGKSRLQRKYFDTFDWRLFRACYQFEEDLDSNENLIRLRPISGNIPSYECDSLTEPKFYWDLSSGRLKQKLKTLINERALLLLGKLYIARTSYEIMDDNEKIVLRIIIEGLFKVKQYYSNKEIFSYLELHPLRGYNLELEKVARLLCDEFDFVPCNNETAVNLYKSLGKTPVDYSSKLEIMLEPDMTGQCALSKAMMYNLDIMEKNEKGIIEDIDIEFLHDFRIAGRRSRSVISQVNGIFPTSQIKRYKNSFAWLSKLTSTHRDLDVFLWDFNYYVKQVSHNGGEELEPLRKFLQHKRTAEHNRLTRALNTARFNRFKSSWRSFLRNQQLKTINRSGETAVIDIANHNIWRNYKKMLNQGNSITTSYTYDAIHRLRKNGKKLRYLIDTFSTLYSDDEIKYVIKCLKRLQNNLGDITDMHVQREMLHNWKMILADDKDIPRKTISAIDDLESLCNLNEKTAQEKVNRRFREFSSKKNRRLFKDIFYTTNA